MPLVNITTATFGSREIGGHVQIMVRTDARELCRQIRLAAQDEGGLWLKNLEGLDQFLSTSLSRCLLSITEQQAEVKSAAIAEAAQTPAGTVPLLRRR